MVKLQVRNAVEIQVAIGAVASVLMLISIGCLAFYSMNRLVVTERWVAHTQEVIATLESGLAILTDTETKQRGYLLTGDEQFLKDCEAAQSHLAGWSKQIRELTADNSQAQHRLDVLEPLIIQRLSLLNDRIKLRQSGNIGAVSESADTLRRGRELMDQISRDISEMRAGEGQLLLQRQGAAQANARICESIIVAATALACLIGIVALLLAQHGLRLRAQAQRELKASQALMESILDNTPAIVFIKDLAGRYLFVNRRFAQVSGRSREDMVGKTVFEISQKELAEEAEKHFQTIMKTGEALEVEETVQYADGPHQHLAVKFPVRDSTGKIWATAGISTDISERIKVEQEVQTANERLLVANKELEAFSYSVSHDLRAPLRHIDGFVGLLRKQAMEKLNDKEGRYLATIANSARQMGALIDDLLIFSRMGRAELRSATVSMNSLVEEVVKNMQSEAENRQRLTGRLGRCPQCRPTPPMLRQVWVNLIGNAVKYTRTRNPAEIEVNCKDGGTEWIFSVHDNGVGFDMQYAHKLFGVFQRLHRADEFEGTGIGLANVSRIVDRHGGRAWADGKPDCGATFYFSLPKKPKPQENHGTIKTDTVG